MDEKVVKTTKKKVVGKEKGAPKAGSPIRRTVVNITMPPEFTEAIKEVSKNSAEMKGSVEKLVVEQQQDRAVREKEKQEKNVKEAQNASNPKPIIDVRDVGPKKSVLWEVLQVIFIFAIFVLLCFGIWHKRSATKNLPATETPTTEITESDVIAIVEDKIAPLKNEIATNNTNRDIQNKAINDEVSKLGFRTAQLEENKLLIENVNEKQKEKVTIATKEPAPQIPEKKVVVVPPPTRYVNLLLITKDGLIERSVKGVRESDVTSKGKSANWVCNGSINNWPRVLSSYRYTDGPPVVGMIQREDVVNSKPETVNVPVAACDVYKDEEGNNVLYEDTPDHYTCVKKGSGFLTIPINPQN